MLAALALWACGTSGGSQAANAAGKLLSGALSSPSHDTPSAFSASRGRCELFGDYAMACPVLANCRALFGSQDVTAYNVCDDSGRLRPITVCKGWQNSEHWCAAGRFPECAKFLGTSCAQYDTLVCQDDSEERHVLRCCQSATPGARCTDNTYYEPERRSLRTAEAVPTAEMPKECTDEMWTSLCQRVLDLEDLQPYLHLELESRVPLKLAKGSPCDGRNLKKRDVAVKLVPPDDKSAIVITRLECKPPSAEVELGYALEGVTASATFELEKGGWQVDTRRVVEH